MKTVKPIALVLLASLALSWAPLAAACPVCFGEAEAPVLDGARLAVIFMGVLVYLVLMGAALMVWVIRRKVRKDREAEDRTQDPRHGLHLIR